MLAIAQTAYQTLDKSNVRNVEMSNSRDVDISISRQIDISNKPFSPIGTSRLLISLPQVSPFQPAPLPAFSHYFLAPPEALENCILSPNFASKRKGKRVHLPRLATIQKRNSKPTEAMKIIIVEGKAWEQLRSSFADFIHRTEQLIGNPPETEAWLDNEAVCRRLSISKRTLQTLRDTGKIPFSMVGHKCYYKESDITEALNAQTE